MKSLFSYKPFLFFNRLPRMESLIFTAAETQSDPDLECTICQETLGRQRSMGPAEETYILPCGHIFGSECITRWLLKSGSYNKDCPICRRSMRYRGCGHAVLPLLAPTPSTRSEPTFPAIAESEMPEKCPVCRSEKLESELSWLERRREAEEGGLRALRVLPGMFGGMGCRLTAMDIERRVQANRAMWMGETDNWVESRRREVGWIW